MNQPERTKAADVELHTLISSITPQTHKAQGNEGKSEMLKELRRIGKRQPRTEERITREDQ